MNWVDFVVLAVIAVSALLAFMRGLVREVLGVAAWVCAGIVAIWGAPSLEPKLRDWLGSADFSLPLAYAGIFIVALILLSVVASMIGGLVRSVGLGAVDRSLGIAYGLARGAALVIVAYFAAGLLVPVQRWPEPVLHARLLPVTHDATVWVVDRLREHRLRISPPAPLPVHETNAADFLQRSPQGRIR